MNNTKVIEQIREKSEAILLGKKDRSFTEFSLRDLDFEQGITLRGIPVHGQAANKILGTLRVKKNFADIGHKMSPEDWSAVSYKLKQAEGDVKLHAAITGEGEAREISWAYDTNENKKRADDQLNYENYFNWVTSSLGESSKEYSLKDLHFNDKEDKFTLTLLEQDTELDVFKTGLDMWKGGQRFTFSGLYFNYAPFFERMVCANGNTARQYGFGTDISKQKYNNHKIEDAIRKAIVDRNGDIPVMLNQAVTHLKSNNASLAEFYAYKNFFATRNENGRYDSLLGKYFDEKPFFQAYGLDIKAKSQKWKSTANSGINAYDFFNHLTWLASHPDMVKMDHEDRLKLQIQASNLLFKQELDLEDVATPTIVEYKRMETMF